MRQACLLLVCLGTMLPLRSQVNDSFPPAKALPWEWGIYEHTGIVAGLHQFRYSMPELGVGWAWESRSFCGLACGYSGLSFSGAWNPFQKCGGVMLTGWSSLMRMVDLGMDMHVYGNEVNMEAGIRPAIGIGPGNWSLTWGWNLRLLGTPVEGVNRHSVALRFLFPVWTRRAEI